MQILVFHTQYKATERESMIAKPAKASWVILIEMQHRARYSNSVTRQSSRFGE